jgi:hypothetical protein
MTLRPALSSFLFGLGLAWGTASALAADPAPRFDPQRLSQIVKTISGDDFEGRAPATPAEAKTVDYLVAQFKAAGLVPGGDLEGGQRGWTQSVPLVKTDFRGAPQFTLQVGTQRDALVQGEQIAVRAAMDGSTSSRSAGAAGLRGLRRERARAALGRLQGRRPEGQDRGRAGQRPRLRNRKAAISAARP